jgi:hypothetical protein
VTRERVLKGYTLHIMHSNGTMETEHYDTDELGTLDDKLTGLMIIALEDIDAYSVHKEWE